MRQIFAGCCIAAALSISALADGLGRPIPAPSQHGLACEPLNLRPGDTVNIKFPENHGSDFAVLDPAGRYFFISFQQPNSASKLQPVIATPAFLTMKSIGLAVNEVQGVKWRQGNTEKQLIFQGNGVYRVLLSAALESEDPLLEGWCDLSFHR
jgi:hypothetical protein